MHESDMFFNERLAQTIRLYWIERGHVVRVWLATTADHHCQGAANPRRICSDMVDGLPHGFFAKRESGVIYA